MASRVRRLLRLLSAMSLALAILVVVAWLVSLFRSDTVGYVGFDDRAAGTWHGFGVVSFGGQVYAYRFTSGTFRFDDSPHNLNGTHVPDMQPHFVHKGYPGRQRFSGPRFMLRHQTAPGTPLHFYFAGVPHGVVALLLFILGAPTGTRLLTPLVRRFHRPPGHCRSCGYDLRASPERCPECGAANPNAGQSGHAAGTIPRLFDGAA